MNCKDICMNKVVLRGANSYLFKIKADKLPEYACQLLLAHSLSLVLKLQRYAAVADSKVKEEYFTRIWLVIWSSFIKILRQSPVQDVPIL